MMLPALGLSPLIVTEYRAMHRIVRPAPVRCDDVLNRLGQVVKMAGSQWDIRAFQSQLLRTIFFNPRLS
jgi:hypothetical protein